MDEPREHCAKWNKPGRERQIPWFHSYVWSNEQTELTRKIETDSESKMTAKEGSGQGVEGWSKKEKGFMDMDNNVVIAGGRGV